MCGIKISDDYEIRKKVLLIYCPISLTEGEDQDIMVRLVMPEILQTDFRQNYHMILEG